MNNFFKSQTISKIIIILGAVVVLLLVFQAGIIVGYHRGVFMYNWSMGYTRGMNDPRFIFAPFMHDADDLNPHGAIGQIVKIAMPTIMLEGPDSTEKIITLSPTTTIRFMHDVASTTALKTGDQIVVIGEPGDNGSIQATFIRIFPQSGATSTMYR